MFPPTAFGVKPSRAQRNRPRITLIARIREAGTAEYSQHAKYDWAALFFRVFRVFRGNSPFGRGFATLCPCEWIGRTTEEKRAENLKESGASGIGINVTLVWENEWQKNIMSASLERVKRQVSARQFQIFDLYALQNWSAGDVARTLRIGVGQIYLAKHRVSVLLKKEAKKLQGGAELGIFQASGVAAAP